MSKKVKRLFEQFAPSHYDIDFVIADDKQSFSGSVTITGRRNGRPSKRLTLHQKGLKITNPQLTYTDKKGQTKPVSITRTNTHKAYDEIRLHSDETLFAGEYTISLDFSGTITKNMDGVYPCFFTDDDGDKQLIATQFESHHAREAFPCVDEPEAKATFQLTLTHARDEVALSNTLTYNETAKGTRTITQFKKTPIMSTYLLAFVVGDIDCLEASSSSGVKIRTFAPKQHVKSTQFALDTAVKCMDYYEDYYDIPFPLEKCDFVALPDFASGAMENWGLITFREQLMVVDSHTSLSTKQYVAIVVAHELTHQWFGNLVTMRWWTDLWLNEGFASWMEYLAVDHLFPEWHLWTQFAVDEQQTALKADALKNTHPIEVEVKHPDEIRTIFDIISYQKGASVIHMLHDYLGADGFRDGLRHYLKTHSYKNTDTVDLWQALEDVTKKPVKEFMGTWTHKSGFPILQVDRAPDHLKISQSIFVTNPTPEQRPDKTLWPVPLLADGLDRTTITKRSENVPLTNPKIAPIKLNTRQTGFYRVNYSSQLQDEQIRALKSNLIDDLDRMGLLSDSFETTKAGYQSVTEFLELLENYYSEDTLPVWEIMATSIAAIRSTLSKNDQDNTLRDLMNPFIQQLVSPQLKKLGTREKKGESHLDTLLRPLIVGLAAGAEHPETIKTLQTMYRRQIDDGVQVNPDLRGTIYSTAARHGGEKEYKELLDIYTNTTSADEKVSIAAAMTSFEQPDMHTKVLNLVRSEKIKFQDVPYWIAYSFMNRYARAMTWEWMKEHWPWMKKHMGSDLSFSRFPLYAARSFADTSFLGDYQQFFTKNMEPMLERTYKQGLEIAETNKAWRARDSEATIAWFQNKKA